MRAGRFDFRNPSVQGRVSEVLGLTVHGPADLGVPPQGFDRADNVRPQRGPGGRSPDQVMRERLEATPKPIGPRYGPLPPTRRVIPRTRPIVEAAKEVSWPDTVGASHDPHLTARRYLARRSNVSRGLRPAFKG
jgi:hypothetical protein